MSIPDKIYLNIPKDSPAIYNNDVLEIATWSTKEFADCKNIEYSRKDSLLEWLESKVYEHNEDRFDDGFNAALGQVIDKLNQM